MGQTRSEQIFQIRHERSRSVGERFDRSVAHCHFGARAETKLLEWIEIFQSGRIQMATGFKSRMDFETRLN